MSSRGKFAVLPRTKKGVVLFWSALLMFSLALQYVSAASPQGALALSGAIYTSNFDGTITNANHYDTKPDVYLTGGPCQGGSHLDEGDYYFEVSNPNTADLLSSDSIGNRKFHVAANGFITSTAGTHVTHATGCNVAGSLTIQLVPFADTTNNGGEYKLTVATASTVEACTGFLPGSPTFSICGGADQKSDNFKVLGPGALVITKAVEGGPAGFSGSFPVSVDCGLAGTFSATIVFPVPGSVTIAKVDAGAVCTVSEGTLPAAPAGYGWDQPTFTGNPATIVSAGSVTVGITNHLHVLPAPSLSIVKSVSLSAAGPWSDSLSTTTGTAVHYRITVTNTGNVGLTAVTLSDDKTVLATLPSGCTIPSTLAVGAHFDCDYSATAATGTTVNTATAASGETQPASDTATVIGSVTPPPPVLTIAKTNNAPLVDVGGTLLPTENEGSTVTYTLAYTFSGTPVSGGVITDVLPVGVTYVALSATNSAEFTFVDYNAATRTLTWTAASVTASGSVSYQATVDTGAAALAQPLTNTATVDSDGTAPDSDTSNIFVSVVPLAETSVPTAPRTDTFASSDGSAAPGINFALVLLAMAGLALVIVMVTPMPARVRERSRRR
jgi:uncharacterized repeat protein (TIGR01451 family)